MRFVVFLRSARALQNGHDLYRPLSSEGMYRANECRTKLGHPTFEVTIASPALRAQQTAAVIAAIPRSEVHQVNLLYPATSPDCGWTMAKPLAHLGNAALEEYFKKRYNETVLEYGKETWGLIKKRIDDAPSALVVGHTVPLVATVYGACVNSISFKSLLVSSVLSAVQGFRVTFDGWTPKNVTTI